jgi:hypothetical protein
LYVTSSPRRTTLSDHEPRLFDDNPYPTQEYSSYSDAEIEALLRLDRQSDFKDEALRREFDKRVSKAFLEVFEVVENQHPNIRLHPGLRDTLRRNTES